MRSSLGSLGPIQQPDLGWVRLWVRFGWNRHGMYGGWSQFVTPWKYWIRVKSVAVKSHTSCTLCNHFHNFIAMVHIYPQHSNSNRVPHLTSHQICAEKHQKAAICVVGAISGVIAVLSHIVPGLNKQQMHTSILTGERWVQELMTGVLMATMSYFLCLTLTNQDIENVAKGSWVLIDMCFVTLYGSLSNKHGFVLPTLSLLKSKLPFS